MVGNLADLMIMLRLASNAIEIPETDNYYAMHEDDRLVVAVAARNLVQAFKSVEKAHRCEYGLSGDKKVSVVGVAPSRLYYTGY
jgi:hypothetical protein